MSHVSIIGSGKMGRALAGLMTKGGNAVDVYDKADADKPVEGDIVVLAVPHRAVDDVIGQRADQLAGRIVVDITNPVNFQTLDSLTVPPDASAAEQIAAKLPQSRVVKAFNTTFAQTVEEGKVGHDVPTTVLIAGDDADAKSRLATLVADGGLKAIDVGPLELARELEGIGLLQIALASRGEFPWDSGFAVVS